MPEVQDNPPTTSSDPAASLPPEVITCLQNARFLHLSTCSNNHPHISLMNYTYLPSTPFPSLPSPTIVMTTPPSSQKTLNLQSNPLVSLLVHDWVSHRPPTVADSTRTTRTGSPPREARSSLASMLLSFNTAAMGRISTSINGTASFLPAGSEEEKWLRAQHLEHNTYTADSGETAGQRGRDGRQGEDEDGGRGSYIEDEEVRVVVVQIKDGRISDWKGEVKDWTVGEGEAGVVNGV